jgi:hypothetical protein
VHGLNLVSKQIRKEFYPLYLNSRFQYIYKTAPALKKFLQSFLTPHPETIEIKLVIKFKYSTEDYLPIFKLIAAKKWERHRIRFQCENWHPTTQEIMDRAFQQKDLWQGSASKVQKITCYWNVRTPTVQLHWNPYRSWQDGDQRGKDRDAWSNLGCAVR